MMTSYDTDIEAYRNQSTRVFRSKRKRVFELVDAITDDRQNDVPWKGIVTKLAAVGIEISVQVLKNYYYAFRHDEPSGRDAKQGTRESARSNKSKRLSESEAKSPERSVKTAPGRMMVRADRDDL